MVSQWRPATLALETMAAAFESDAISTRSSAGGGGLAVVWLRLRGTLRSRRSGYLALVVIIALLGGLSMGSLAAARRTQSSYPVFDASTHPSDLNVAVYLYASNGVPISATASNRFTRAISAVKDVARVRTVTTIELAPLNRSGAPELKNLGLVIPVGSLDGLYTAQDRLAAVAGQLADPRRAGQVELTASAAQLLGLHLGQRVPFGLYTPAESAKPGFGSPSVPPAEVVDASVVGIVEVNSQVVQDDVDRAYGYVFVTPALLREAIRIGAASAQPVLYAIQVRGGEANVPSVERAIVRLVPPGSTYTLHVLSRTVSQVELALKPESLAIGGFGIIAGLVCLLLAVQAISRQVRAGEEDRQVLRSLGLGPLLSAGDGLAGVLLAVLAGTVVAFAVAVALSPLAPLGPIRPVYPRRGVSFDWTVLGVGVAVLVVVLFLAGLLSAYRDAPHRVRRRSQGPLVVSGLVGRAEAVGLPVSGIIGTRFALEPGRGRTAVPVRSALFGAILAVVTVVATLTFADSLTTLVATPRLYGWNWSYAIDPSLDVPPAALPLLSHDRDVAAFTGIEYYVVNLDGQQVPVIITLPNVLSPRAGGGVDPAVAPPILSGTGVEASHDVVMGAATLAGLHKRVGDWVTLTVGNASDGPLYVGPTRLHIVGTTTLPAVGYASFVQDHTSMGYGALFPFAAMPASYRSAVLSGDPNEDGPPLVFVRMRPGVSAASGRANLDSVAGAANRMLAADPATIGNSVSVLGVERPAQIVNYKTIGSTPVVLAVGLAAGAVAALGFTIYAAVRRRRRDLALLKAVGFTPRQLARAVAWQATVPALVGIVAGIPLGIVGGRLLWDAFAHNLNAVPDPRVPVLAVVLVALGALVFANLVAIPPGRRAARTPTSMLLRTE